MDWLELDSRRQQIIDRLGWDSSVLRGLEAEVSGDARYLGSVGRDLVILGG